MPWILKMASIGLLGAASIGLYRQLDHQPLKSMRPQSVAVLARDGSLLRLQLASDERYRLWTPLKEMPPALIEAVKLKEDRWFDWHPGVNPVALLRAAFNTAVQSDYRAGASTLTMQLVRLRDRQSTTHVRGKLQQIIKAMGLSAAHSKREVLEAYLNFAPYGGNVEGVGAASRIYFNKGLSQLNVPEVLTLAVLPQRPRVACNARGDCLTAELRRARARLFQQWLKTHPQDARWADVMNAPMPLRSAARLPFRAPHAVELSVQQATVRGVNPAKVNSTLDPNLQALLERQMDRYLQAQVALGVRNAAAVLLDVRDMEVRALVGSGDYFDANIAGQINGAAVKRSPGSTLKPLLYALAIDQGQVHPATVLRDVPSAFGQFTPENFDGRFMGPVTVEQALIRSRNIPAVQVAARLSQPNLHGFLQSAGVAAMKSESHYGLALVLGGGEVSVLELARLYAMLSNDGVLKPLRFNTDDPIENGTQLLSPEASFITRDMLSHNPRPDGGRSRLPVAWKTGTSWGFRDAWTAGTFGPYVLIVWLGNFDNSPNPALIGAQMAAPLFFSIGDAIQSADPQMREPTRRWPLNLKRVAVCTASGDLPNAHCPETNETWFIPGKSPIRVSTLHRAVVLDGQGRVVCEPGVDAKAQVFEYWPSDLAEVYRQAGLPRRTPPSTAHCALGMSQLGRAPQITSPRTGATYVLPLHAGEQSAIQLQATLDADVRRVFWFADDALIDTVLGGSALEWNAPTAGRFRLRVTDDHGRSDERWVEIASRR